MTKEITHVEVKNARKLADCAGRYARVSNNFPDLDVGLQIEEDNPHLLMLTTQSKNGFTGELVFSLQDTTPQLPLTEQKLILKNLLVPPGLFTTHTLVQRKLLTHPLKIPSHSIMMMN